MEEPRELKFNNLPKDIVFDIFSRIPLINLYQIRCVCKKWLFFLDLDTEFRGFYHQKHKTSPILLFTQETTENPSTQLSYYYIDTTPLNQFSTHFSQILTTTIFTCNGILCLISAPKVSLYDPVIKRLSNLPNSPRFGSTFSWAFGYSKLEKAFKVLHFYTIEKFDNFHYCQVKEVMCEIITNPSSDLGTMCAQQWRLLGKCPFDFLGRKTYAYVGGKFYWMIEEKKFNPECVKIMSFHIETETFGMVCFPRTYSNRSVECLDLVEIKDKLCLTDRLPWESTMDVWMMIDEGFADLWVKKYKIDLMGIDHHDVKILGHLSKINDCEDDEGEILIKFGEQSFGYYELGNGCFTNLASGINMQGWELQSMIDRKCLL